MASELDVELEQYEKVVGNLNFSTPVGSRSASRTRDHHLPSRNPSNKLKLFPLCYYVGLYVARSCGFSCSDSSSAVDTR